VRSTLEDVFVDLVKAGDENEKGGEARVPPTEGRPQ
jgi:hypothetical protein